MRCKQSMHHYVSIATNRRRKVRVEWYRQREVPPGIDIIQLQESTISHAGASASRTIPVQK